MNTILQDQDVKFILDEQGHKKEVVMTYEKFREISNVFDEILPDRNYDLTDALSDGLREVAESKRNKTVKRKNLSSFINEL